MSRFAACAIAVLALSAPTLAHAYIGPGLGAGALAAVLGVIGSIFVGLFAVIYYPIKRVLKKRRAAAGPQSPKPE